jgi:hypothetical protein
MVRNIDLLGAVDSPIGPSHFTTIDLCFNDAALSRALSDRLQGSISGTALLCGLTVQMLMDVVLQTQSGTASSNRFISASQSRYVRA